MSESNEAILYEMAVPKVARITLNRPEKRNAQNMNLLYALDAAFQHASYDDDVSVIILDAAGDHFSAGHDLGFKPAGDPDPAERTTLWSEYGGPGWEGLYTREREAFYEMSERWRNAPKPVIAAVQGAVIAGGLILMWACDLIVAADDARFRDNTGSDMGVPGVEFFNHPFELGVRKAKEFLFTGGWLSAEDALAAGMVNHVVARSELATRTLELAQRVAETNRFTLKLIKDSVNGAQDAMGRREAMRSSFANHQIGHLQNMLVHGLPIDLDRLPEPIRSQAKEAAARLRESGAFTGQKKPEGEA